MTTSMDPRWAFSLIAGLLVVASAGAQTAPAVPGNTAGQSTAAAPAPAQTRIGLALRGGGARGITQVGVGAGRWSLYLLLGASVNRTNQLVCRICPVGCQEVQ